MKPSKQKKLILVGLRVAREMALQAFEMFAIGVPQPVYSALQKTVETIMDAETEVLAWEPTE
jgi:hypothetical protein